ncbi:hypothetical protein EDEG_00726 [Edhazardia aedis USNM 41457]|uniref:Uncharacterized protein n=1 Tax=Edhazardia aedis (strain USNM 41457) TaxID=1003232 RepID=J9DCK4_EDHAE|nr:hypothetical protein EDEG_00726 [Edhazardia aedis USNM 41457]|eukprot:EJW05194.1 hypothetical protein EDEG_00726 [Edhazardia aedis USNM 41457]
MEKLSIISMSGVFLYSNNLEKDPVNITFKEFIKEKRCELIEFTCELIILFYVCNFIENREIFYKDDCFIYECVSRIVDIELNKKNNKADDRIYEKLKHIKYNDYTEKKIR